MSLSEADRLGDRDMVFSSCRPTQKSEVSLSEVESRQNYSRVYTCNLIEFVSASL